MKKILIISALLLGMAMVTNAQSKWIGFKGFFKPTTVENLKGFTGGDKAMLTGVWQARFDLGLEAVGVYFETDEDNKITGLDPRAFSKVMAGIFFTHTNNTGFTDWAGGIGVTMPNTAAGYDKYGIGIAVAYSIFQAGANVDLGVPFKQGFSFLTGLKIDLFNLVE